MSDAIMQWEIDRKRFHALQKVSYLEDPMKARTAILHAALDDVVRNHGTLVVVSTADKLTVVQRATAADLDPDTPPRPNSDGVGEAGETEGAGR